MHWTLNAHLSETASEGQLQICQEHEKSGSKKWKREWHKKLTMKCIIYVYIRWCHGNGNCQLATYLGSTLLCTNYLSLVLMCACCSAAQLRAYVSVGVWVCMGVCKCVHTAAHFRKSFEGAKCQLLHRRLECFYYTYAKVRAGGWQPCHKSARATQPVWVKWKFMAHICRAARYCELSARVCMHQFNSSTTQLLNCACEHLIKPQSLEYEEHDQLSRSNKISHNYLLIKWEKLQSIWPANWATFLGFGLELLLNSTSSHSAGH